MHGDSFVYFLMISFVICYGSMFGVLFYLMSL